MFNLRSILSISTVFTIFLLQAENTTEIHENLVHVAQNSKDLAYSVGSLLHSVGNEVIYQTQKLGDAISAYVESFQQSDTNNAFQISIKENLENISVVFDGFGHIDTITGGHATLTIQETFPPRVTAIIQINPETTATLYSNGDNLMITLVTVSNKIIEEQKEPEAVKAAAVSKKQKMSKTVTTKQPIDLTRLTIDLDTVTQQMTVTIPYSIQTERLVPVNIK